MEIGKEQPAITVEPVEDPFRRERELPEVTPTETPEPVKVPEKVPAGGVGRLVMPRG